MLTIDRSTLPINTEDDLLDLSQSNYSFVMNLKIMYVSNGADVTLLIMMSHEHRCVRVVKPHIPNEPTVSLSMHFYSSM